MEFFEKFNKEEQGKMFLYNGKPVTKVTNIEVIPHGITVYGEVNGLSVVFDLLISFEGS